MWQDKVGDEVRGGFLYNYTKMAQHVKAPQQLANLLDELKPTVIIEIGTLKGGLTMLLVDAKPAATKVVSFDIVDHRSSQACGTDFEFCQKDCFSAEGLALIKDLIAVGAPALVLCDGGDKPKEFNAFAPLLKPGDVIMAHDYHRDRERYEQIGKFCWQWWEIKYADIRATVEAQGLQPYRDEHLSPVAWACFKKP